MADNKGFMGRGFSFPFRVDPSTNRIAMSSAGQDVEEAIRIILRTNLGERVMLPEFGTAAGEFLFSDSRAERIAALEEREPRIMDIDVQAARESSGGVLNINISYTLRATNNQFNMVYPFYMMEGEGR